MSQTTVPTPVFVSLVVLFVVEAYRELFPSEDVLLAETAPRRRLQSLDQDSPACTASLPTLS
ncbi:MAG: hypothetical protein WBW85_12055 [Terriglobales bacterium]|jgi:hypothetical protein